MIQNTNGLLTKNRVSPNTIGKVTTPKFSQRSLKSGINVPPNVGEIPTLTKSSLDHAAGGELKNAGLK